MQARTSSPDTEDKDVSIDATPAPQADRLPKRPASSTSKSRPKTGNNRKPRRQSKPGNYHLSALSSILITALIKGGTDKVHTVEFSDYNSSSDQDEGVKRRRVELECKKRKRPRISAAESVEEKVPADATPGPTPGVKRIPKKQQPAKASSKSRPKTGTTKPERRARVKGEEDVLMNDSSDGAMDEDDDMHETDSGIEDTSDGPLASTILAASSAAEREIQWLREKVKEQKKKIGRLQKRVKRKEK